MAEINLLSNIERMRALIKENEFEKAISLGRDLYSQYPENVEIIKLMGKAQKRLEKSKKKYVNDKIKSLDHLIKQGELEEVKKNYEKLDSILPNYKKLQKKIHKLDELIFRRDDKEYDSYIRKGLGKIKELINKLRYTDAIKACTELLDVDPSNIKAQKFLEESQTLFVDQKLPNQKVFVAKNDYKNLLKFYRQLHMIAPNHTRLKKLIEEAQKKLFEQDQKLIKEKTSKLYGMAIGFFNNRHFDKSYDACEEILRLDPDHRETRKLIENILAEKRRNNENELLEEMLKEKKKNSSA